MREREMHERVQQFLKVRMRAMVLPATLGLSLALAGCPSDGQETSEDGGNPALKQDGGTIAPVYSAAMPDAGKTDAQITKYMAPLPDAGINPEYMAQLPDAGAAMKYMAQLPDAGGAVALYMAQSPDAGIAVRYMAQQPDTGGMVALYMALNPS
jgi:hypothetical protein